ncbi:FIST N-terminal domain-containing protein [Hydrogenimonas sp.]
MQTITVVYESVLTFQLLPTDELNRSKSVLVQIYSTYSSRAMMEKIAFEAQIFFPNAVIVGLSTCGTIKDDTLFTHKTIITISSFEKTKIASSSIEIGEEERLDTFGAGKRLAKNVVKRDTKLLILFADTLRIDAEELLEGILSVNRHIPICGALAGDHGKFFETLLVHQERTLGSGAVIVSLNGSHLKVGIEAESRFAPVGPELRITSFDKNVVHMINGTVAQNFYRHYLGESFFRNLPESGMEIALVAKRDSRWIARTIVSLQPNGAIRYAGNLDETLAWKFGYIAEEKRFPFCFPTFHEENSFETLFLFADISCRITNEESFRKKISLLSEHGRVAGFFGYGEFCYLEGRNELLNQSMVLVGLSERGKEIEKECEEISLSTNGDVTLLNASLAHLNSVMSDEFILKEETLSLLAHELPYGLLLYDRNLQVEFFNEKASGFLGLERGKMRKRDLASLEEWLLDLFRFSLENRSSCARGEVTNPLTGEKITLEIHTRPILHRDRVRGAIATLYRKEE